MVQLDVYIGDHISVYINTSDATQKTVQQSSSPLKIIGWPFDTHEPFPSDALVSITKLITEAGLDKCRFVLSYV